MTYSLEDLRSLADTASREAKVRAQAGDHAGAKFWIDHLAGLRRQIKNLTR